jgi:hypothetical protein
MMLVKTVASAEFGESAVIAKVDLALHADRVRIGPAPDDGAGQPVQ